MEKKLLEVGDVVYRTNRTSQSISKITISRVTKTQAIGGGWRFKREYYSGGIYEVGKSALFSANSFDIANDKLDAKYKVLEVRAEVFRLLNSPQSKTLTLPQLLALKSILSGEEVVGWIPLEDIDMGVEENWRREYLGMDKKGTIYRGFYADINGKKYLEDEEGFIYPTHLIPISKLPNLPIITNLITHQNKNNE